MGKFILYSLIVIAATSLTNWSMFARGVGSGSGGYHGGYYGGGSSSSGGHK